MAFGRSDPIGTSPEWQRIGIKTTIFGSEVLPSSLLKSAPRVSETVCMRFSPCGFNRLFIEPFWVYDGDTLQGARTEVPDTYSALVKGFTSPLTHWMQASALVRWSRLSQIGQARNYEYGLRQPIYRYWLDHDFDQG